MNFSQALELLKERKRVRREKFPNNHFIIGQKENRIYCQIRDSALMPVGVNWFLGSDDLLADDWEEVKDE